MWARGRRRALDLTQHQMAELVGCATVTIRKIEADERRPSKVMAMQFAKVLGIDAGDFDGFVAAARGFRAPATGVGAPHEIEARLPVALTRFVGREGELDELERTCSVAGGPARLITVIGPPGVGKTRFALEAASRLAGRYDTPAVLVQLAHRSAAEEIVPAVAAALGADLGDVRDERTSLIARIRTGPLLLVLDNLEQIQGAGQVVADLLETCDSLSCLVTSRRPLLAYGEHEFELAPLTEPAAVQLFIDRSSALLRNRIADHDEVAAVCRLLDGLPLAIELAARRVRDHSVAELRERIDSSLSALGSGPLDRDGRHATMEATVAWSHHLLDQATQSVARHAAVFRGGFTAGALAAVVPAPLAASVPAALQLLAESSLVGTDPVLQRHQMLEVVRAYALDQLREAGEEPNASARHAEWMVAALEAAGPRGVSADLPAHSLPLAEDANIRAALTWTLADGHDLASGRRLLAAIGMAWYMMGRGEELLRWLPLAGSEPDDQAVAVGLAAVEGLVRWSLGENDRAAEVLRGVTSLADSAEPTVARWQAEAAGMLAMTHIISGDLTGAGEMLSRCCRLFDVHRDPMPLGLTYLRQGRIALLEGSYAAAAERIEAATEVYRAAGSAWGVANSVGSLAEVALAEGRLPAAQELFLCAVDGLVEAGAEPYAVFRLTGLANTLTAAGRHRQAALVAGIAEQWIDELGVPLFPLGIAPYQRHRGWTADALGAEFATTVEEGRAMARTDAALRHLLA